MLRIRLLRVGKKNRPSFRLVVTPQRSAPQTGRFLEVLGAYDPIAHTRSFKKERIEYWLSQGAQASDTVSNMFISEGITKGQKVAVHSKAKEKEAEEEAPKETKGKTEPDSTETKEEVKEEAKKETKRGEEAKEEVKERAEEEVKKEVAEESKKEEKA